jgi:hypothetical protein
MARAQWWKRVAVGLAAATLLAGCGDDGESSSSTTTMAPTTPTTLSQQQLDKQKAQRIVLTAADVPGFTLDPADPSDDSPELDAAVNACLNNNPLLVQLGSEGDPRGVDGDDFRKGETQRVSSSVTFADNDDQAKAAFNDLGAASFTDCFSRALTTRFRNDPEFTNVSVTTSRLPALTVGDQSLGFRNVMRARVAGTSVTLNFDFTFLRVGGR